MLVRQQRHNHLKPDVETAVVGDAGARRSEVDAVRIAADIASSRYLS